MERCYGRFPLLTAFVTGLCICDQESVHTLFRTYPRMATEVMLQNEREARHAWCMVSIPWIHFASIEIASFNHTRVTSLNNADLPRIIPRIRVLTVGGCFFFYLGERERDNTIPSFSRGYRYSHSSRLLAYYPLLHHVSYSISRVSTCIVEKKTENRITLLHSPKGK